MAPVEERGQTPPDRVNVHVVEPGDTMYSIAWRYGLDFRRLAAANNIDPPFTIHRRQRLKIAEADPPRRAPRRPVSEPRSEVTRRPAAKPARSTGAAPKPAIPVRVSWRWPLQGKIIQKFSTRGTINKGIDIAGKVGEPVKSAAHGTVVYSGSGIRGYGNLVIIKHSDEFLSAYAHNHRIRVKESESVQQGQVIAEVGRDGLGVSKLHFEIRREGKPVNPLQYLPN